MTDVLENSEKYPFNKLGSQPEKSQKRKHRKSTPLSEQKIHQTKTPDKKNLNKNGSKRLAKPHKSKKILAKEESVSVNGIVETSSPNTSLSKKTKIVSTASPSSSYSLREVLDGTYLPFLDIYALPDDVHSIEANSNESVQSHSSSDVDEKIDVNHTSTKTCKKIRLPSEKLKRRRKSKKSINTFDSEDEELRQAVARYAEKTKKLTQPPPILRFEQCEDGSRSDVYSIINHSDSTSLDVVYSECLSESLAASFQRASKQPGRNRCWTCLLCQKESGEDDLGDLFGPFSLGDTAPHLSQSNKQLEEFWLHGSCVLWSPSTLLHARSLAGLTDLVALSLQQKCSVCNCLGATVGCGQKSCTFIAHYRCAVQANCKLNHERFTIQCAKHKDKYTSG